DFNSTPYWYDRSVRTAFRPGYESQWAPRKSTVGFSQRWSASWNRFPESSASTAKKQSQTQRMQLAIAHLHNISCLPCSDWGSSCTCFPRLSSRHRVLDVNVLCTFAITLGNRL